MTTEAEVLDALQNVIDPELGIDVVTLGLVYRVVVDEREIHVDMTTTSDECPMGEMLLGAAQACLAVTWPELTPEVHYTDTPPWTPARISPRGRMLLGIPG